MKEKDREALRATLELDKVSAVRRGRVFHPACDGGRRAGANVHCVVQLRQWQWISPICRRHFGSAWRNLWHYC